MGKRHLDKLLVVTASIALALSVTAGAAAKRKRSRAKKPDAATVAAIENATQLMSQESAEDVEAGIQSLGLLGTKEAVTPLIVRVRAGLPEQLLETAIVTLMALGQPDAGPVLIELTRHRRPGIRMRAIEALVALDPPGAEGALSTALSDGDADVRAAAASGLGEIGSPESIERLFLALDKGNLEASGAIGKLIDAKEAGRLLEYLGKVPFRSLSHALGEVLQRKDVGESVKLRIVARLEEVGTPEVKGYLGDLMSTAGTALGPKVTKAVLRAMQEIAD
ncbi:MAG: HEAT repeat domain-containing protein [Myxococcales bacterium]|jgi:hypothetical protein